MEFKQCGQLVRKRKIHCNSNLSLMVRSALVLPGLVIKERMWDSTFVGSLWWPGRTKCLPMGSRTLAFLMFRNIRNVSCRTSPPVNQYYLLFKFSFSIFKLRYCTAHWTVHNTQDVFPKRNQKYFSISYTSDLLTTIFQKFQNKQIYGSNSWEHRSQSGHDKMPPLLLDTDVFPSGFENLT